MRHLSGQLPARISRAEPTGTVVSSGGLAASVIALCLCQVGCDSSSDARVQPREETSASASATAQVSNEALGLPETPGYEGSKVAEILNRKKEKPYRGKVGSLSGTVTVKGDPPPATSFKYRPECSSAVGTYGSLFRVGQDDALADVLVGVTGYQGFVPFTDATIKVDISGCAFSARTIAMAFGQHLEIRNLDSSVSHLPYLQGARSPSLNVAVQKGLPIKLYPRQPTRMWLRDQMGKDFMVADVFVLRYSTFDVTDLNGRYEITGIPVGEVEVTGLLPATMRTTGVKKTTIKEGKNELDLVIEFDAEKDLTEDGKPSRLSPASGSAKPATSASSVPSTQGSSVNLKP